MRLFSRYGAAGGVPILALLGAVAWAAYAQPPGLTIPDALRTSAKSSPPTPAAPAAAVTVTDKVGAVYAERDKSPVARQGDTMRFGRNVAGDAKPILIDADRIATWEQDGMLVLMLSGKVLVQQSVVQCRFNQGVAWVDAKRYRETGILHADVYAEGNVRLDTGTEVADGGKAVLDLNSRGEFRLRGAKGNVQRQNMSTDPLFARGRALVGAGAALTTPVAPAVRPAPVPAPAPVPGTVPSSVVSPPPPPAPAPPGTVIQRTSFIDPKPAPKAADPKTPPPPAVFPGGSARLDTSAPADKAGGTAPATTTPATRTTLVSSREPSPSPVPPAAFPGGVPDPPVRVERRQPVRPSAPELVPTPEGDMLLPRPSVETPPGTTPPGATPPAPFPGPAPLPGPTRPAGPPRPAQPAGGPVVVSGEPPLEYTITPRRGTKYEFTPQDLPGGRRVITIKSPFILNVRNVPKFGSLEVEADRAVLWQTPVAEAPTGPNGGESTSQLEMYVAGSVIMRTGGVVPGDQTTLEADEMYYDVKRNVAVALNTRTQIRTSRTSGSVKLTEPMILKASEFRRTGPNTFEVFMAEIFSSKLPTDPGLKLTVDHATVTNRTRPKRGFLGLYEVTDRAGNPVLIPESILNADNVWAELEGVPFFYTPKLITDARDPLGPLEGINLGMSNVFGFHAGVALNGHKLFGLDPADGTHWKLFADYLSRRGPALGTTFEYRGEFDWLADPSDVFGRKPWYDGLVKANGIYDQGTDILGGRRPYLPYTTDEFRGRYLWRTMAQDLPYGLSFVSQSTYLSDRNYLEQYFKREFDTDPNQANFLYLKMQQDNWAVSAFAQYRQADWITTTEALPRVDGYLLGHSFFDRVTSNTHASIGYYRLRPSSDPLQPLYTPTGTGPLLDTDPTSPRVDTARAFIMQELALPLHLGAFNVVPYAKGAAVEYTSDIAGNEVGRVWGGLGVRANLPLTALYPDAENELFNVHGLNHKITVSGDYFYARSNEPYSRFPQLDRLHDDASMSLIREITPRQPVLNRNAGLQLATSPLFDPQLYAIRRGVENRIDTLEEINVARFDVRQRLQTKRGAPGFEHVVDWMTLDTSISVFPEADRDNFGKSFAFAEYYYLWNIGDRTAFESTGWYDPQDKGPAVFTAGVHLNRPDRTSFYIGYRQIDPLRSRLAIGSVSYVFSPKYSATATVAYDLGTSGAITNTLIFTRTGTDLQVSAGVSYNSIQENLGIILEIVPSLVPLRSRGNNPAGGGIAGLTGGR